VKRKSDISRPDPIKFPGEIILLLVLTYGSRMLGFYFVERVDEINNYE